MKLLLVPAGVVLVAAAWVIACELAVLAAKIGAK